MKCQPALKEQKDIDILRDHYINKRMSTTAIAKDSNIIFGFYISPMSIYSALKRNKIGIRSQSESVSLATRIENYETTYLTEDMIEWFDGFLLGDGSLRLPTKDIKESGIFEYARLAMGSTQRQWTEFAMSKFQQYQPREIYEHIYDDSDLKHPNPLYTTLTRGHPDIVKQAERWYILPECKKIVPKDVRITPTSVMLWYLGDGSLVNNKTIKLATCSFTDEEIINILMPKLEEHNIHSYIGHWKQYPYIYIRRNSIGKFFDFIGHKSPISCYDYKFDYKKFFTYKRICDITKNKREQWRAQWFCKNNKIEFTKDEEFNKFFLFTDEQARKLRERLNKSNKTYFTEEDIKRIIGKYNNGLSLLKVSESENSTVKIVRRVLIENKIKLRNFSETNRRYNFNENFFSNGINSEEVHIF